MATERETNHVGVPVEVRLVLLNEDVAQDEQILQLAIFLWERYHLLLDVETFDQGCTLMTKCSGGNADVAF